MLPYIAQSLPVLDVLVQLDFVHEPSAGAQVLGLFLELGELLALLHQPIVADVLKLDQIRALGSQEYLLKHELAR